MDTALYLDYCSALPGELQALELGQEAAYWCARHSENFEPNAENPAPVPSGCSFLSLPVCLPEQLWGDGRTSFIYPIRSLLGVAGELAPKWEGKCKTMMKTGEKRWTGSWSITPWNYLPSSERPSAVLVSPNFLFYSRV